MDGLHEDLNRVRTKVSEQNRGMRKRGNKKNERSWVFYTGL